MNAFNLFLDSNTELSVILFLSILLLLILLFFFLFNIISHLYVVKKTSKHYRNNVVSYDYKTNTVSFFNEQKLDGIKTYSFDGYLSRFQEKSRKNITEFFTQIIENIKDIEKTSNVDILSKKGDSLFCVLEFSSINRQKKVIHFKEYSFKYLPPIYIEKENKLKKVNYTFRSSEKAINNYFLNTKSLSGATFIFSFKIDYFINDKPIDTFIFYSLKDIIAKYSHNKIIIDFSLNSFLVHDFNINNQFKIVKYINNIIKDFKLLMELNGFSKKVQIKAGVVEHRYFPKDINKTIKAIRQTINEVFKTPKNYLIYDENINKNFYYDQSYKSEIENIIKQHLIKFSFQAIIDVNKSNVMGYISFVNPSSNVFSDIDEVKQYSYNLGLDKKLFSEILKYLCSKFLNETLGNNEQLLFYNLKFFELESCNSILGYIQNVKNVQLVLVFNEQDIIRHLDSKAVIDEFRKLVSKGYILALNITERTLDFPDELYNLFTYFVFDSIYFEKNYEDISHSYLPLIRAIEKVLKYKKKNILINVNTTSELEIRIKEGLKYLSGNAISETSEMLLPISKKVISKINKFNNEKKGE